MPNKDILFGVHKAPEGHALKFSSHDVSVTVHNGVVSVIVPQGSLPGIAATLSVAINGK